MRQTLNNLVLLRPNDGIPAGKLDLLLNKIAKNDIQPFKKISTKNYK